jgi:hypothetical protein
MISDGNGRPHLYRTAAEIPAVSRVVHDDPTCRVCRSRPGLVASAAPIPEPYPNPYHENNPHGAQPEGGPDGHHWYHGTRFNPRGDSGSELRTPEGQSGKHGERADQHWNTDLGVHFTSLHGVARNEFATKGNHIFPDSRVAHASLHMRNPIHFGNEDEFAHHAASWAHGEGHRYLPEDDQAHKAFVHGNYPHVEEHDADEGHYRSYGYHEKLGMDSEDRERVSALDLDGPRRHDAATSEHWLGHHPDRARITSGYRQHLQAQGHDGVVYGNTFEGPRGHASAIAFPQTPVNIHHWEHLDPNHEEDGHGRTAGKGKARHHAPDVARRADQEGDESPQELDPGSGGDAVGTPLRALVEHPKVTSDLKRLPRPLQAAYHDRVDDLRRGQAHSSTHTLNGPLKGWNATSLNFKTRVVHRNVGDELHVLSAGNHDEAYDQGVRRTALQQGDRAVCPCGEPVEYDLADGYQHLDGSISHDDDLSRYSVSDLMDLGRLPKHGRYTAPKDRLFGPTYGLDHRLWGEDGSLNPVVRGEIIFKFGAWCRSHGYNQWGIWAKIVFFGSEASGWTSKNREGNGDFDLSIGIDYAALRATVPGFDLSTDAEIADMFTQQMHAELNNPEQTYTGVPGTWDQTWFCNLLGWSIEKIRPYAAYDVVLNEWIVKPPDLPQWSVNSFPEGPGLAQEIRGIIEMAQGILAMPEPYRTQNGSALWTYVHSNRSDAFGAQGEGWWDSRNVIEKGLDQKGLMQGLFECHRRAVEDPSSLDSPQGWSNDPASVK